MEAPQGGYRSVWGSAADFLERPSRPLLSWQEPPLFLPEQCSGKRSFSWYFLGSLRVAYCKSRALGLATGRTFLKEAVMSGVQSVTSREIQNSGRFRTPCGAKLRSPRRRAPFQQRSCRGPSGYLSRVRRLLWVHSSGAYGGINLRKTDHEEAVMREFRHFDSGVALTGSRNAPARSSTVASLVANKVVCECCVAGSAVSDLGSDCVLGVMTQ